MKSDNEKMNTPEENYEAASLELALYRIMRRDHDAVKAAMSEEDEKELSQIAEEKMPRMLGFIDQQMKRVAVRSNLWKHGRRILQTAAVAVLNSTTRCGGDNFAAAIWGCMHHLVAGRLLV